MTDHGDYSESGESSAGNHDQKNVKMTNATMIASLALINDILEQITVHDAPAQNETTVISTESHFKHSYQELKTPHSARFLMKSPYSFVNARNGTDFSSNANCRSKLTPSSVGSARMTASSFETENIESKVIGDPSRKQGFISTKQNMHEHAVDIHNDLTADSTKSTVGIGTHLACVETPETFKMAHVALASLCRLSLDKVKSDIDDHQPAVKVALDLKIDPDCLDFEIPQAYNSYFDTQFRISNMKKSKKKILRIKRLKLPRLKTLIRTPKCHDGSFPAPAAETEEEKKDDSSSGAARLQLFGSEYARHLSTCQLAPILPSIKEGSHLRCTSRRGDYSDHHSRTNSRSILFLEDASEDIKNGAVLDIVVTEDDMPPPPGYYRISQTSSGKYFGLAKHVTSSRKVSLSYLNVKKEPLWDKAAQRPCVTAITVIYPDRKEFVPPGLCIVRTHLTDRSGQPTEGPPANLNGSSGTHSCERVFLCFRRSREGNPITGIIPLAPDAQEGIPAGYTVIERTPRNFVASLTCDTNAPPVFLAYRQRLANIETLRPMPLLVAVQEQHQSDKESKSILKAYYCTGGAIVEAEIGRFHIMDRSTHSLLSPSSVANRLHLIELSRRKGQNLQSKEPSSHYKRSEGLLESSNHEDDLSLDGAISNASFEISTRERSMGNMLYGGNLEDLSRTSSGSFCTSSYMSEKANASIIMQNANLSSLLMSRDGVEATYVAENKDDAERRKRLDAMNFIPSVETAVISDGARSRLEVRKNIIAPILTACYTRHGGAALVAVEGLTSLLTTTDFFLDDVDLSDANDNESSRRLTILDLAVQAVCDIATATCQETMFPACVTFVERAVSFAQGQLNTRTVGFALRFYFFVFYFDACIPRQPKKRLPFPSWRPLSMQDEEDFPMLYDLRVEEDQPKGYLPGGAPQAAALALKDLISFSIVRLGKVSVTDVVLLGQAIVETTNLNLENNESPNNPYVPLLDSIFSELVDSAVDNVDRANFTQLALHQIHRSGGSELFWHEMLNECGQGLFAKDKSLRGAGRDLFIMIFAMLQQLIKVSSGKFRSTGRKKSSMLPKDVASKLLSLELLLHFLEFWSDEQEAVSGVALTDGKHVHIPSVDTLAYVVRRSVVPCLLWNTQSGIENPQVFRRIMSIVSELWGSPIYRKQCKVELGMLIEHFAIKILELGPQIPYSKLASNATLLSQQVEVICEIKIWFSYDPSDVLELYLNYDTDMFCQINDPIDGLAGSQWQLFQRICAGLCNIAETCGEVIATQIRQNQTLVYSKAERKKPDMRVPTADTKKDVTDISLVLESTRLIRKTSIDAISQIVKAIAMSAANAAGQRYFDLLTSWTASEFPTSGASQASNIISEGEENSGAKTGQREEDGEDDVIKYWRNAIAADQKQRGYSAARSTQESLSTAFQLMQTKSLKKAIEYLVACNVITPSPRDIANFLHIHKNRLNLSELGHYLSESGANGSEAEYWSSIRYQFIRASSFIGMTVEEGLRHFLTNSGFKLPGEAQRIDRMVSTFAQAYFEDNAGDSERCPFRDHDIIYLIVFAMIMLNTDLHKVDFASRKGQKKMTKAEFINNLRGALQGETVPREYLIQVYESIESNPIVMNEDPPNTPQESQKRTIHDMISCVRDKDSLLRALAVHDFQFASVADFTAHLGCNKNDALADLTRSCVSKTWHHWHGVVNTCMDTAHLDPQGMEPSVEILLYALCATICLNMHVERSAFIAQLVRLKAFEEHRQGRWVSAPTTNFQEEKWVLDLEEACSGTVEKKICAMQKIHGLIRSLQAALQSDVPNKIGMAAAVTEIVNGSFLLQDPSRVYVRSGDLIKKSLRTGRSTEYRFYLFSDTLIYAAKQSDGRFKIHEEMPLHLMKIVDWFPPAHNGKHTTFEVHHPRKTFQVVCKSIDERKTWVADVRSTISDEIDRKMKVEAARLAFYSAQRYSSSK